MNTPNKQLINLLRGWPSLSLLPHQLIAQAAQHVFTDTATAYPALCYGPDPGYEPLRRAIGKWLTGFYKPSLPRIMENHVETTTVGQLIDAGRICITGGASQNLACILQVFTDSLYTRYVWCVSPVYFLAGRIFEDNGFMGRLKAIPEDGEGIDIAVLEQGLRDCEKLLQEESREEQDRKLKAMRGWNKFYRHVVYAVPTFSNPSSKTMSLRRRQELVRLARHYDVLIITDDVYDQLQWLSDPVKSNGTLDEAVQPRVVDVDRFLDGGAKGFGNAVSNGSFSKIIGPGVRTGWAEGTPDFAYGLSQCGSSRSGGSPSQAMGVVLTSVVESGALTEHISNTLQPAYSKRYAILINAIEEHLVPLGVKLPQTDRAVVGGYFIWFELPDPLNADGLARRAKAEENLIFGPGSSFVVAGEGSHDKMLDRSVRVCLAWEDENLLQEGIERLAAVIKRMIQDGDHGDTGEVFVVSSTGV